MSDEKHITKASEGFGVQTLERSAELSAIAVAAAAKAEVESAYVMALKAPRNEDDARVRILAACRNPIFAKKAKYRKPVGGNNIIVGPSIRFAEEMVRCWKNILVQQTMIYDDDQKRVVKVVVRDLEANVAYSKEISLEKTVERRSNKDREVVGQRTNSYNQIVYVVKATEDELAIKEAAAVSKIIRNNALRHVPQHLIDEAMLEVEKTITSKVAEDPDRERKDVLDGLAKKGVMPTDVERFIGKPNQQMTPQELVNLREILTAIEDGSATWQEFLDGTAGGERSQMATASQPETKGKEILSKIDDGEQPSQGNAQPTHEQADQSQQQPTIQEKAKKCEASLVGCPNGQAWLQYVWRQMKRGGVNGSLVGVLSDEQLPSYIQQLQQAMTKAMLNETPPRR